MHDGEISELSYADAAWRRASACSDMDKCVELRRKTDGTVAVRNSRNPDGVVLTYERRAMRELLAGVKDGEFDDLAA